MLPITEEFPWETFRKEDGTIDLMAAFKYISNGYECIYLREFKYPIKSRQVAAHILFEAARSVNII